MNAVMYAVMYLAHPGYPVERAMEIASAVYAACAQHGELDTVEGRKTIVAIMAAESSFNPKKINRKGCMGLMQVAPVHVQDWANPLDVMSIRRNVEMGVGVFASCLKRCRYRTEHALSLYGGHGKCEASAYSRKVMRLRDALDAQKAAA